MAAQTAFEGALRRDRVLVVSGLLAVVALSWAYLFVGAGVRMDEMDGMLMPVHVGLWTPGYALLMFLMWATMMAAMMLPSAAPMILLYGTIARCRQAKGEVAMASGAFTFGYAAIWFVFSFFAVAVQFALEKGALLSPTMGSTSVALSGAVLIAVGLYQWTPLKQACLRQCRSPLEFVMTQWCEGARGAFRMGLRHGAYCVGCCWLLMLLLFVGGIMNLAWVAVLALFILVEKVVPAGHWIGRAAGVGLIVWGSATLATL